MSPRYLLSLDQSTSATKACLFDESGEVTNRVTIEHHQYYPQPGHVEHDPMEIIERSHQAIEAVVQESGIEERSIAALGITNQRETVVAWDARSGAPIYNALVWQDERGTPICTALNEGGATEELLNRTGLVLDSYFSASKLQWLVENVPACQHAADAGSLMAGTIDAWLIWNFTDREVFATDHSNASRTLLYNIKTQSWDPRLIELFNLPPSIRLPEVRFSDEDFGYYQFRNSHHRLPIIGVMGDSHAALYGHAGFSSGDAKTTFGTGSSVMMNVGPNVRSSPAGIVTSVGWGVEGNVTYVFEGNIHHTGDTVRWARDQLNLFADYTEAEERAASLPDNGGVYLVPAFSGLGAPYWAHGIRAAITGMSRNTTADHLIRAALESIAFQVADVLSAMADDGDFRIPAFQVDGGPAQNRFLMQFLADILGVSVRVAGIEEVSARGVAFVAGVATGVWKNSEELSALTRPAVVYEPAMMETERQALLAGWHAAVNQVLAREAGGKTQRG